MAAKSSYLENLVLKWVLTSSTTIRPTSWYVALHTQDPTVTGTVGEVSGSSYSRQTTSFSVSNGLAKNSSQVRFGPCTDDSGWGTISHFSLWDALTGGNCLYVGAFDYSRESLLGDTIVIDSNEMKVTET